MRRGYDRGQVDAYIERLSQAGPPPSEPPAFDLVRRGYDRLQVDTCIEELRARRNSVPQPGQQADGPVDSR